MLSRRDFLKFSALLAGVLTLPPQITDNLGRVRANADLRLPQDWLSNYLTALEGPHYAPLNTIFDDLLGSGNNTSILVYDILNNQLLTGIKTEAPLPVASAFKAGQLFWFMDMIDPQVWTNVPPQYWSITELKAVPTEYQSAWERYFPILYNLYQSVVISENNATGFVFSYVADKLKSEYPLALFNDWSHQVVGLSQISSMGLWRYGIPERLKNNDERYMDSFAMLSNEAIQFNNVMTTRDLGLYYAWWQNTQSQEARQVGQYLLSQIYDDRRSNLEKLAFGLNGISYSKNGSLLASDTGYGAVVTDAGLVEVPGQGYYLIAYMTALADTRTPRRFERIGAIVQGQYADQIRDSAPLIAQDRAQREYMTAYLTSMYPEQVTPQAGQYNYAFVKHEGIEVYYAPTLTASVRNPVISESRFGVHLLMQGALIRYQPVDTEWVQLVPDSMKDNVKKKFSDAIYLRLADLHPVDTIHTQLIPYFMEVDVIAHQKLVIIDVIRHEMTLLERDTPVIKTPVALNEYTTPRGMHNLITRWLSCSMQPWAPGVPFTSYFHNAGYAIHGSPWQR
jgi:hypothetical protein